ncbi:hypothetical protein [Skermanella pratensis]|uniref:hypothetical protein n=1 Tax=Skermanella pratensis TaxID=2233999 RepID=UPI001301531C|nr:hypothetical protein [Skermanella pratensis]
MSKKLKNPTAWDVLFGQKQPPTAAERLISNARRRVESVMDEPVKITLISQDNSTSEANMTVSEYRQLYGHRIASIIGETENDCRLYILPYAIETDNGEGEAQLLPFECNTLVYVVFDSAKHDPNDINVVATQLLADAGSADQAVWDAAVVSSTLMGVTNES